VNPPNRPAAWTRARASTLAVIMAISFWPLAGCKAQSESEDDPGFNSAIRPVEGQLAFPGAVGFGAGSHGGRGGKVIAVTTLADSGEGSLRECVETKGPRVCVFKVSGIIRFHGRPPIIREPYLTIAGQTAPAPGITLTHDGGPEARTPLLIKNTHDIVIRHIRVRNDRAGQKRGSEDAFTIETSDNIILDHVSGSWARDELVNGYGDNDRITISNSLFAQGIPRHDKCALLASDPKAPQRVSFIGNLCAHNGDRNPDMNFPPSSCVEVVNNVFYNAQSEFAEVWASFGGTPVNIVGNNFISGPNTSKHAIGIARNVIGATGDAKVYIWHNMFKGEFVQVGPGVDEVSVDAPVCPLTVKPLKPASARQRVLANAGAWPRDSFDRQMAESVRERRGGIVKVPGAIPAEMVGRAQSSAPYPDVDRDGMDDDWERVHHGDPFHYDPWSDSEAKGATNLDAFLDYLHRRLAPGAGS
jgi:Pectate lyase